MVAGAGIGFMVVLRATADRPEFSSRLNEAEGKLDEIGALVNGLVVRAAIDDRLKTRMTRDDFEEAVNRTIARLEAEVESRIEQQTHAIDALRTTVLQTDELLQRVLEALDRESLDRESLDCGNPGSGGTLD